MYACEAESNHRCQERLAFKQDSSNTILFNQDFFTSLWIFRILILSGFGFNYGLWFNLHCSSVCFSVSSCYLNTVWMNRKDTCLRRKYLRIITILLQPSIIDRYFRIDVYRAWNLCITLTIFFLLAISILCGLCGLLPSD